MALPRRRWIYWMHEDCRRDILDQYGRTVLERTIKAGEREAARRQAIEDKKSGWGLL